MLDPVENSLFDIPDYENTEDETFAPLPPPLSPGQQDGDGDPFANGEEGEGEVSKLADAPVAKRRSVKRPQPKLDSQRLVSERGLPALRTLFNNVKFRGKGHETEDLRLLMQKMENWAHRLYPKLQFEDFIDRVESLGSKKEVQTCLKRIRLDMPLTHEDFIGNDGQEEALFREDPMPVETDPFGDDGLADDPMVHSTPAPASQSLITLTEEQQRRIELNKQLALERRLARLKAQPESSQPLPGETEEPADPSSQLLPQSPSEPSQVLVSHSESQPPGLDSPEPQSFTPSDRAEPGSPLPEMMNGRDEDSSSD
ncbi:hypothetical protein GJAV_G00227000 [Gymnothorax javanicus]|nr:hypothetical protein GJAV_G00227000 [Gymnothorax javanicus]